MVASFKKINSAISLTTILVMMVFLISSAYAADTGNISVKVKGAVIKGLLVEVSGGDLSTNYEKKTGSSGAVTFKDLPAGDYTVTPRKTGVVFSPQSRSITVVVGKTLKAGFSTTKEAAKVGMAYCVSCHAKVSADVYAGWLGSPHGNFQYVNPAHHEFGYSDFTSSFTYPNDYTSFTGFPNASTIASELEEPEFAGKTSSYCLNCHGPAKNDNTRVATFPLVRPDGTVDMTNASTQIGRPVIGCEACHGSGRKHISSPGKALTYESPGPAQCGQCHNKNFPEGHLTYHPQGAAGVDNTGIYEAYQVSAHTHSMDDSSLFVDATAKKKTVKALCAKCHSDQGARIYRSTHGDATTLPAALVNEAPHTEYAPVQCRTCHDAHDPSSLLENASAATGTATARSAEFNTCTNCHQLLDGNDAKITPYHSDHQNSITTNHYDNPATQALEGYNIHRGSDDACSMCHNPHVASVEINEQWAESAHGELTGDAWLHYDWKTVGRKDCQRCHTPIGFANIVTNQATYDPLNNNFSHLTGLQNDTLTCNGCHTDGSFKRRQIGAYNGYVAFPSGDKVKLDDDSNLCMMCHQGRASKLDVDLKISQAPAPPIDIITTFTNIHYLAAAATFFGHETRGGYEYDSKTYVNRSTFPDHQGKLDTCVKCHLRMESNKEPDHSFKPLAADCAGSGCHVGIASVDDIRPANTPDYDGDANTTEGLKGEVDTMGAALYAQIRYYASHTLGFPPSPSTHYPIVFDGTTNPYWFKDTNNDGIHSGGSETSFNKFDPELLKACYNYQQYQKEPHTFIHNHKYVLQLMYDSIQDLGGDVSHFIRPS